MTRLAATATTTHLPAWLVLAAVGALLLAAAWYLGACLVYPYTNCGRCHGLGRFHARDGRAWRPCRRCKGTGARLRVGRRVINHLHHLRNNAR
jgi:hypothetical protein